jgi:hypothetical protein
MRTRAVLVAVLATACARERTADTPRVEAIFDVPREYRVLATLPCASSAALVYLVVAEGDLYGFRPDTLAFHHVGRLRCPATPGATPNSMAVDRSGTAWINYSDGSLHRASTRDARCVATGFEPRGDAFQTPGMAFVSSGPDLLDETLFLWGGRDPARRVPGRGLATIDRTTLDLAPVGDGRSSPREARAELTGTGDGRLYGFFTTTPATLAEIDPETGAKHSARPLPGVSGVTAWAFSFWGGDFYLYWARFGETSHVTRVSGRDGSVEELLHDVGFRIVGAGVSTCAPLGSRR